MSFEKLFSPIKIRELELRNRVVMSAMGTHESAASEDGRMVTDKLIAYHVARAKGGCGLNTIEVCSVDAASAPTGFLSIADDRYIPGMKKLCSAVHAAGGRVAVQLWQGGLAVASDPQAQILLPSDMPLSPEYTVPGITEERIQSVIEAFGQAARRVVEAGIDVIEFHCAHNYLPHSFLSGGINRRTDGWGGSFENRKKFPLACIQAIRANMPEGMPLFMRIDCQDDMLEGGLTIEEVIDFCKCAGDAGVDVLNISRGNILTAATVYEVAPVDIPHGFNVEPAARIRRETGLLTMPCGRINTPEMAEDILMQDKADLVVMALSIADDRYIPGMKKLCSAVHAAGGRVAVQLWQGGLAVASDPQAQILLPSDMPLSPEYTVPGITEERIQSVIEAFGQAARRVVEAGIDVIEFHCAHNYLPHSFLSGGINRRTDGWGGSFENRKKFPLACIQAIRANMPEGMPLFMRIDCQDDMLEGGLTIEEVIDFCKCAGDAGVDVLNISRGNILTAATVYEVAPVDIPHGFNVEPAARIRRETGLLTMPCGRINTPEMAEDILMQDKADLVVMARAQLADPEFCNKAKAGKLNSIKYCIGCDQGCYDYFCRCLEDPSLEHITCLRNPAVLEEETMALRPAPQAKKVLIAGGGIAGIEAADALYKRGHHPILCEAGDTLGGQFVLAGAAPRKGDFQRAAYMAAENIRDLGVEIRTNTPVTPALIAAEKPDAVIIAIGSKPIIPNIPGADSGCVVESHKLLAQKDVSAGKAVVIGGGLVGMEVAEFLAGKGSSVTVVEMKDSVLGELGQLRKIGTHMAMAQEDIQVLVNTTCKEIRADEVIVEQDGKERMLAADLVVMAIGSKPVPSQDLQDTCAEAGIPCYVVGDALAAPRLALNAIHEAYRAALSI